MRNWFENQKMLLGGLSEAIELPAEMVDYIHCRDAINTACSGNDLYVEVSLNKLGENGLVYLIQYKTIAPVLPEIRVAAFLHDNQVRMSTVDVAGRQVVDPTLLITGADRVFNFHTLQKHAENVAFLALLGLVAEEEVPDKFREAKEEAEIELLRSQKSPDALRNKLLDLAKILIPVQTARGIEMPDNFLALNLSVIYSGEFGPTKVISGDFHVFQTVKDVPKVIDRETLQKKFLLEPDRKFSEEEKLRIHPLPEFYSPSERVLTVLSKIKKMWELPPHQRLVNVLFEGPAGTGKTMDAKAMASLLGLPYSKITCSANMDESAFTEVMLPVANEDPIPIPSADEILFDPEGSYKTLTGKTCETVTDDMLKNAVKAAKAHNEKCGTVKYVNFPSDLVLAFEHGWLCEIQEPSCISDPGVMSVLNSALERGGQLNLAQRTITRHPSCIFVITTNPNYAGCRPINEAVRDRMQDAEDVQLPTTDEMVRRLEAYTGCKDKTFLHDLTEGMNALNEELENEGIVSHVSLRGMSDFVLQVMCGFDLKTAIDSAIVNKITTDKETKAMIENFLDESTKIRRLSYSPA